MKNKIYYIFAFALTLMLASCSDGLSDKVKMDINMEVNGVLQNGNIIEIKKSTPVKFKFNGNPDFISFYSGESGREYSKREQTESAADEIKSELELYAKTQYGIPAGSLKVFLSTEFSGLTKKQSDDITLVANTNWTEITSLCNLPIISGQTSAPVRIPLNQYLGKELTLAFWYNPLNNIEVQSRWEITGLRIVNTNLKTGVESSLDAISMGFAAFDVFATPETAYNIANQSSNISGIWNFFDISKTPSRIIMHSSAKNAVLNSDWLISKKMIVNARTPDKGVSLKPTHIYLNEYSHTYNQVGEYKATFIGTNENNHHHSRVIKEFTIKIID